MTFQELRNALTVWKVVLARSGNGFVPCPAVKLPEDEWAELLKRFEPELKRHAWAIHKHILDPWPLEKIIAYMQHHGVGVKVVDGAPSLSMPTMDEPTRQYHAKTLLPHLKAARREVLEWYSSYQGDAVQARPSVHDERTLTFKALTMIAKGFAGSVVVTYSAYTRAMVTLPADAPGFPRDATKAWVAYPRPHPEPWEDVVQPADLSGHTPPPKWHLKNGVMPPHPCLPPPGWEPKTQEQIRAERARWYRENWKTAATFKEDEE